MSDYGDYDYDVYEPTEEELVQMAIEDDADPDYESNALQYRQDERWRYFLERVNQKIEHTSKSLDSAYKPKKYPQPTWWKMWQPPVLDGSRVQHPAELIYSGALSISSETKYNDIPSYWGMLPTRVIDSYTTYMDFTPPMEHGMLHWDLLRMLSKDGRTITQNDMHGNWGYWDEPKGRFRSIIRGAKVQRLPDNLSIVTDFAIMTVEPPPYGLWLPVLDLQNSFAL